MNLSNYVLRTKDGNQNVLLNTVTKEKLPVNASEQELEKHLFLQGQEEKCVQNRLYASPVGVSFDVIPTWKCNLRCGHCSVLHQLTDEDESKMDTSLIESFVNSIHKAYPDAYLKTHFVGGEPMLRADTCLDIIRKLNRISDFSITTNGIYKKDEITQELFESMKYIIVSLDGTEKQHNKQRKAYKSDINPFATTINNIKQLVADGFREKVSVQAAVKDNVYTREHMLEYYKLLLRIGIPKDNIKFSGIHPTITNPKPQDSYLNFLNTPYLNPRPCCKFRYMSHFVIDCSNSIFSNFFQTDSSKLGHLTDGLDAIQNSYKSQIQNTMPCLKDSNCSKCPVLGYCWGGCIAGNSFISDQPSLFCNKKELIQKVNHLAEHGQLIQIESQSCMNQS